jgi:hypothetical protein
VELPPQIAQGARTSPTQERAGIKGQLRRRAGDGGLDRGKVTGGKGNDTPYCRALWDLETAVAGQRYLFAPGYGKLATDEAMRAHGRDLGTILPETITVALLAERAVATPVRAQGDLIHSDRIVTWGTGATRSRYLGRVLDVTDTPGQRRTSVTRLLAEAAARITPLRA